MIKVVFLVTSTVEAVNGRTFEKDKAYWQRPDQYAFWDARGRIALAPDGMPTENAPFSVMRAGRNAFDVVGPANRRLNTAALPWADAEALRSSAEADWLAKGWTTTAAYLAAVSATDAQAAPEPQQAVSNEAEIAPALTPSDPDVVDIEIDIAKAVADAGIKPAEAAGMGDLSVAKGPGGRFFVKRGDVSVSRGFATEEEAEAEKVRIASEEKK